jgi:hypothetical protein
LAEQQYQYQNAIGVCEGVWVCVGVSGYGCG